MTVKQLKEAIEAAKRLEDHPNLEERLQLQLDAIVEFIATPASKPSRRKQPIGPL